jgi:hypothetical protein
MTANFGGTLCLVSGQVRSPCIQGGRRSVQGASVAFPPYSETFERILQSAELKEVRGPSDVSG